MKIQKLTLFTLLVASSLAHAQEQESKSSGYFNFGVESNSQWYIDDDKIKISEEDAKERFRSNNYIKGDYIYENWEFGMQLESYSPKALLNYAPEFDKTDIGTLHVRYRNANLGLDVTAGHLYEQFGSGLALRFWEDRQLGINNALFGARVIYDLHSSTKLTALAGRQRVGMGFDLAHSFIYGANLEVGLSQLFNWEQYDVNLAGSYVGRKESESLSVANIDDTTSVYSLRADVAKGGFYMAGEYVYKSSEPLVEYGQVNPVKKLDGNAVLVNMGYSESGFGLDVNLRRLQNMNFYSQRNLAGNQYNQGVMNYLPALTKQYDFALQNIYVYQAQPATTFTPLVKAGEIGGQFDLFYQFKEETTLGGKYGTYLAVNGSFWNALDMEDVNLPNRSMNVGFFDFGRKYYNDLGLEVRKKFSERWQSVFSVVGQYYNQKYIEETFGEHKSQIVAAETIYKFSDTQSLRVIAQHLWADGDKKNWAGGTLEYAPSLKYSFYIHDIYNYGNDDPQKQLHYYNVGGAFVKGSTRVAVSYGRQRGGMICVGGVCRLVPESSGLTLNITTNF